MSGIFTGNRTLLGTEESIIANESYANEFGAAMLVIEAYQNDAEIFDKLISCDFLEVAITEAEDSKNKEAIKENVLVKLWEAILKIVNSLKSKIVGIVEGTQSKFRTWRKNTVEKYVKEHRDAFIKNDLSKVKKPIKMPKSNWMDIINPNYKSVLTTVDFNKYIGKTAEQIKADTDVRKSAEDEVYGKILNKGGKFTAKEFKTELFNIVFDDKETEMPFTSDNKSEILKVIEKFETVDTLNSAKKDILADLKKKETEAKDMVKKAKKAEGKDREDQLAVANACRELVGAMQRIAGNSLSAMIAVQQKVFNVYYALFKYGASYKAKGEAFGEYESLDSNDIFNEAMLESELAFEFAE